MNMLAICAHLALVIAALSIWLLWLIGGEFTEFDSLIGL
jgi:hypothetical protein